MSTVTAAGILVPLPIHRAGHSCPQGHTAPHVTLLAEVTRATLQLKEPRPTKANLPEVTPSEGGSSDSSPGSVDSQGCAPKADVPGPGTQSAPPRAPEGGGHLAPWAPTIPAIWTWPGRPMVERPRGATEQSPARQLPALTPSLARARALPTAAAVSLPDGRLPSPISLFLVPARPSSPF